MGMKKELFKTAVSLIPLLFNFLLKAQINLVPCGDFECVVASINQCNTASFTAIPSTWSEFNSCSGSAPNIYSTDYLDCASLGVPNSDYGTQYPLGGLSANHNFLGMESHLLCGEGIRIELSESLKEGQAYNLRFNAVKKSSNDPVIEFRLGANDNYVQADCPSCSQDFMSISTEGGPNNDQWGSYVISFIADRCDLQWLFLRLHDQFGGAKLFIDNISINDDCAEVNVCSPYLGNLLNVYSNNVHNSTDPLTFYNLGNVEQITVVIFTDLLQIPVRHLNVFYPNDFISWDGKDNQGDYVPNGNYSYIAVLSNNCHCRTIQGNFQKTGDFHIINATAGFYLAANAQTFYHLENVEDFELKIFDEDNNLVQLLSIIDPKPTVSWNGLNGAGSPVAAGSYSYECRLRNSCEELTLYGGLFQILPVDPQLAFLDYSSVPKQITCPYTFYYNPHASPPPPCCAQVGDLIINNRSIAGVKDFKLNHDIRVLGTSTVVAGSDIYFQAGHEISLSNEFSVQPGSQFAAVILPCTGRYGNPNPNDADQAQESELPIYKTVLTDSLTQNQINVSIFPNPTSDGRTMISIINSNYRQIELYNCFGQRVAVQTTKANDSSNVILEGIDKGAYFLRVILENGEFVSKQLIVL